MQVARSLSDPGLFYRLYLCVCVSVCLLHSSHETMSLCVSASAVCLCAPHESHRAGRPTNHRLSRMTVSQITQCHRAPVVSPDNVSNVRVRKHHNPDALIHSQAPMPSLPSSSLLSVRLCVCAYYMSHISPRCDPTQQLTVSIGSASLFTSSWPYAVLRHTISKDIIYSGLAPTEGSRMLLNKAAHNRKTRDS